MSDEKTHVVIVGNSDLCGYWTDRFDDLEASGKLRTIKLYCTQSPAAAIGHISANKKDVILVVFDYGMKDHLVSLRILMGECHEATYFVFVSLCANHDEHEFVRKLLANKVPRRYRVTADATEALVVPLGIR